MRVLVYVLLSKIMDFEKIKEQKSKSIDDYDNKKLSTLSSSPNKY